MPTPSEYRLMAEENLRWARQARSDKMRDTYIELARLCTEAASNWTAARRLFQTEQANFLLVSFHDYATRTVPSKGDGMLLCSAGS